MAKARRTKASNATNKNKKGGVKVSKQAAAKLNKNITNLQKAQAAKRSRGKYEAPNNNTEKIGCYLNVNIAKGYLRDLISNTLTYDLGTINAQYPYAALTELLFLELVRSTVTFNKKNHAKADLYEITYLN